jgi:thrombospondin type 3 repeat protein
MRSLFRTFGAVALAALVTLIPAAGASAAKKPKPAAFAAKYHLKGAWRAKDADHDGLKNLKEFKLGTNPKKADTDKDGLKDGDELASGNDPLDADSDGDGTKDGAEHAGTVTAVDADQVTIRQFNAGKITVTLDSDCGDDEPSADDSSVDDGSFVDVTDEGDDDTAGDDDEPAADDSSVDDVDVSDDDSACSDDELAVGDVLSDAEFETDGGVTYLVDYTLKG